jgi:hypothetical protein
MRTQSRSIRTLSLSSLPLMGLLLGSALVPGTAAAAAKKVMHGSHCQPMGPMATEQHSFERGIRHMEAGNMNFTCGLDRESASSTSGLLDLELRFFHTGDQGHYEPKTVSCTALAMRTDGTAAKSVTRSITVQPGGYGKLDFTNSVNASGAYGNIGVNCFLPPNLWIVNLYMSEP